MPVARYSIAPCRHTATNPAGLRTVRQCSVRTVAPLPCPPCAPANGTMATKAHRHRASRRSLLYPGQFRTSRGLVPGHRWRLAAFTRGCGGTPQSLAANRSGLGVRRFLRPCPRNGPIEPRNRPGRKRPPVSRRTRSGSTPHVSLLPSRCRTGSGGFRLGRLRIPARLPRHAGSLRHQPRSPLLEPTQRLQARAFSLRVCPARSSSFLKAARTASHSTDARASRWHRASWIWCWNC